MSNVSVSPTNGNGPTQGQRKTLTRVGIEITIFGFRSPLLYRLSYKVRREKAVGTEDLKVTEMNMYKYKEGLRFCNRFSLSLCGPTSISRANAYMAHMG